MSAVPVMQFRESLAHYVAAGFPALYVTTHEEMRAEKEIAEAAKENERGLFVWSLTKGWQGIKIAGGKDNSSRSTKTATTPMKALSLLEGDTGALPEENV